MGTALDAARDAFARDDWTRAVDAFTAARASEPLDGDDLDRLSTAAYLLGRDQESLAARMAAYEAHQQAGHHARAARSAFWTMFGLVELPDRRAEAAGWIARARRHLEAIGETTGEQALITGAIAFEQAARGCFDAALAGFAEARALATRFGDADALALAMHGEGRALIKLRRVADGLAMLDDVLVGVSRGETGPIVTGVIYCGVIGACHELYDWERAREWTAVLSAWCEAHPDVVPFRGTCLVRRAEVFFRRGAWDPALEEARRACDLLDRMPRGSDRGLAYYQIGDVHRLRGDLEAAEAAYRRAHQAGGPINPGMALLRLARHDPAGACAAIKLAVQEAGTRRDRAPLLRASVDVAIAVGDLASAREAAAALGEMADDLGGTCLRTMALAAGGAVSLADGDLGRALSLIRTAIERWQALEVPYEVARGHALLGSAYQRAGDLDGAELEFDVAEEIFERLGARADAADVAARRGASAATRRGGLTGREVEVLRLVATGRSNRAIAGDLAISEKTVARHLSNIFTKLDLSSRAAATAYAYEHKLL